LISFLKSNSQFYSMKKFLVQFICSVILFGSFLFNASAQTCSGASISISTGQTCSEGITNSASNVVISVSGTLNGLSGNSIVSNTGQIDSFVINFGGELSGVSGLTPFAFKHINNTGTISLFENRGSVLMTANNSSLGFGNENNVTIFNNYGAFSNNNTGGNQVTIANGFLEPLTSIIGAINNYGSITATGAGSYSIWNLGTINTLNNYSGATIQANDVGIATTIYGRADSPGIIGILNNAGTIRGDGTAAILNYGTIRVLTNTGSLISTSGYGIKNDAAITTLNNSQGRGNDNGALTYRGTLPTNYNIVINSTSNFGKIIFTLPSGSTTFGIYAGSTVAAGTYQDVLTGVTDSHLSSLSGTYGSYSWTLASDTTNYDLTITGSSPSRLAYNEIVTTSKFVNTATQLEAIRTNGTKSSLTNILDNLSADQLESAVKKIQGTSIVKTSALPVQAQSNFKTTLSTITSPGSSSSMTNVTKTNQGNLTFADLQTNNLYAKIQPANYSDDSAFFDYKNNQVPVNVLEFFKSNRNVNLVEKDDFKESGIFLRTFGSVTNYAAVNGDDNSYGSDSYGLLGGFQHKIDENLYQGYSLGFSKSKLTLDAGEGNTKTNTIHVNVYRKMDEKEYGVTASLGGYVSFIDNVRNISETNEILKSSPTNGGLDFSVQYVKKMDLLGLNFYPSASFTTTYGIVKNYKETGGSGSALEIKSHNILAIKPEIGFTLENNFVQTDKITEGANFSLFANRQQYLDGHTNTSSMIGENSWSASTLPKTKDDFLTAGIGYVAKNIDEKSDLNFNFFYTQSTNNSLNSSLFSISYNKTF
jgi:hypothetical protein